jgi:serine/threonine-protein kinase RsbW
MRTHELSSPQISRDARRGREPWHLDMIASGPQMSEVIGTILGEMAAAGYCDEDCWAMRLALMEAVANAVNHGHGGDTSRPVTVRHRVDERAATVEVEDQGPGFDPEQVPDPLAPEHLDRPGGRGLFLMRQYLSWIRYNKRGNRVTLCKRHSDAD